MEDIDTGQFLVGVFLWAFERLTKGAHCHAMRLDSRLRGKDETQRGFPFEKHPTGDCSGARLGEILRLS